MASNHCINRASLCSCELNALTPFASSLTCLTVSAVASITPYLTSGQWQLFCQSGAEKSVCSKISCNKLPVCAPLVKVKRNSWLLMLLGLFKCGLRLDSSSLSPTANTPS